MEWKVKRFHAYLSWMIKQILPRTIFTLFSIAIRTRLAVGKKFMHFWISNVKKFSCLAQRRLIILFINKNDRWSKHSHSRTQFLRAWETKLMSSLYVFKYTIWTNRIDRVPLRMRKKFHATIICFWIYDLTKVIRNGPFSFVPIHFVCLFFSILEEKMNDHAKWWNFIVTFSWINPPWKYLWVLYLIVSRPV